MLGECIAQKWLHSVHTEIWAPVGEAPHRLALEAAGHHCGKSAEITIHIQSQAVLRDPPTAANTDRGHLAITQPNARHALHPLAMKVQVRQHIDHHLLQLAQVPMQVALTSSQIKHGISHQLTRHVMGHFATAIDAMQGRRRSGWIKQQMLLRSPTPQGVTARVLQDPNRFWSGALV